MKHWFKVHSSELLYAVPDHLYHESSVISIGLREATMIMTAVTNQEDARVNSTF
jgi:hypothetical protein